MTAPGPSFWTADTTGGLEWLPALRDILDGSGGSDIDSSLILGSDWIVFDSASSTMWQSPTSTLSTGTPDSGSGNTMTIYRKVSSSGSEYYQIRQARFAFFEPGDRSPSQQSTRLLSFSQAEIDGIRTNPALDESTFTTAADMLGRVSTWLSTAGQPTLDYYQQMTGGDGSQFQGSAAQMLLWALSDLHHGMGDLNTTITAPTSWPALLTAAATAITAFKSNMEAAWNSFRSYRFADPNTLIAGIVGEISRQVAASDASTGFDNGTAPTDWTAGWMFDFSSLGLGSYDLGQAAGWTALNQAAMDNWRLPFASLQNASRLATATLNHSLDAVTASLQRGVAPWTHLPAPGQDGPGPDPTTTQSPPPPAVTVTVGSPRADPPGDPVQGPAGTGPGTDGGVTGAVIGPDGTPTAGMTGGVVSEGPGPDVSTVDSSGLDGALDGGLVPDPLVGNVTGGAVGGGGVGVVTGDAVGPLGSFLGLGAGGSFAVGGEQQRGGTVLAGAGTDEESLARSGPGIVGGVDGVELGGLLAPPPVGLPPIGAAEGPVTSAARLGLSGTVSGFEPVPNPPNGGFTLGGLNPVVGPGGVEGPAPITGLRDLLRQGNVLGPLGPAPTGFAARNDATIEAVVGDRYRVAARIGRLVPAGEGTGPGPVGPGVIGAETAGPGPVGALAPGQPVVEPLPGRVGAKRSADEDSWGIGTDDDTGVVGGVTARPVRPAPRPVTAARVRRPAPRPEPIEPVGAGGVVISD